MFSDSDIRRWRRIAKAIDSRTGEDLLQDFLLKVLSNGICISKLTDAYVYTSINNTLKNGKRNKGKNELYNYWTELNDTNLGEEEDFDNYIEKDEEIQNKLNAITNSYDILNPTEQKLFFIHFTKGLKIVDISKETGISQTTIFLRIKTIKQKIKDYYDKNN